MSDEPDNIVLVYLRRLDAEMDRAIGKISYFATQTSIVESGLASVRSDTAGLHHAYAAVESELDQIRTRLDRTDRRRDLQDVMH